MWFYVKNYVYLLKFLICWVISLFVSMEEAKKNMYAFSTTTYTGFQCTVDEETSEKFKGYYCVRM